MNFTFIGIPIGANLTFCQMVESIDPRQVFDIIMIIVAIVYSFAACSVLFSPLLISTGCNNCHGCIMGGECDADPPVADD